MSGDWPDGMEMIRQARESLGMFAGTMAVSPEEAWEEALDHARRLVTLRDATVAYFDNPMEITVRPVIDALLSVAR